MVEDFHEVLSIAGLARVWMHRNRLWTPLQSLRLHIKVFQLLWHRCTSPVPSHRPSGSPRLPKAYQCRNGDRMDGQRRYRELIIVIHQPLPTKKHAQRDIAIIHMCNLAMYFLRGVKNWPMSELAISLLSPSGNHVHSPSDWSLYVSSS